MTRVNGEGPRRDVVDAKRSDARRNESALLRAATAAIHREGLRVPLGTIAEEAGVGIATLYRHFPTREHLLNELTHRSFELVLGNARDAQCAGKTPIDALRRFVEGAITLRNELVLPLHGGPPVSSPPTIAAQAEVHRIVDELLDRGRKDGSITGKATAREVIVFGAMLAQPHTPDRNWDRLCRRLLATYLAGLAPYGRVDRSVMVGRPPDGGAVG